MTHLISALDHVIGKLVGIQLDSVKHENLNAHKCNKQMKTVLINLETECHVVITVLIYSQLPRWSLYD